MIAALRTSGCALAVVLATTSVAAQKPTSSDPRALERRIHHSVNDARDDRKLAKLYLDERLSAVAHAHSEDMARRGFFSHVNPNGEDPSARGKRAGYNCRKVFGGLIRVGLAENLFESSPFRNAEDFTRQAVTGWMNSPGHRKNILEPTYTLTGVGVAVSGDAVYITQLFC